MKNEEYISPEQVKNGVKKCHIVVNRLLKDAKLLKKNGRYSASVSLAILAYEEVSKAVDLRSKIKNKEGLTKPQWKKMSGGMGAHDLKLSSIVESREKRLNRLSQQQGNFLNLVSNKIGLPGYADLQTTKNETMLMKDILPKLNAVEKDCFYLDWDEKTEDWTYFDRKFKEKTKNAIAEFLITITESLMISQKFSMDIPTKPFVQYSDEEWKKVQALKSCDDLKNILKYKMSKEFSKMGDIAIVAIDSYPKVKKKKLGDVALL